jgi:serine protease Do
MHDPRPRHAIVPIALLALAWSWLAILPAAVWAVTPERMTPTVRAVHGASPAVVNIQGQKSVVDGTDAEGTGPRQVNGMGTGVVIDPRGYILTNFHVVDGVKRINVTLDTGQTYVAKIVARDAETDLAVILIRTPAPLSVIKLGTSQDLMPGETVIAVGNAFGYENTVTTGIISALHRNVQVNETQQYLDLIQTDASINPGNSGGPLLNIDGEMIGVNVAVRAGAQGIGFAIPIDKALDVAAKLMSIEELDNHWHGMTALSVEGPLGPVTVARVQKDSPAKNGGIERGDLLEQIGSVSIRRPIDVERALLGRSTGDRVPVVVRRNDQSVELSLTLAALPGVAKTSVAQPSDALQRATWESLGMILDVKPRVAVRQANTANQGGLRIVAVRPGSSAAEQGVREGDLLVRMHRWKTDSEQDLRYIVDRADSLARAGQVKFYIVRGTDTFFGNLEVASTTTAARR